MGVDTKKQSKIKKSVLNTPEKLDSVTRKIRWIAARNFPFENASSMTNFEPRRH